MQMDSSMIPVQPITFMDSDLFKAAEKGKIESFNKYQGGDLHCLVDGRQNTALHIYSRTGGLKVAKIGTSSLCGLELGFEGELSIPFVEQLVGKCPSLLLQPNDRGEIPLHIAARCGQYEIVEALIELAKEVTLPLPQPHEDLEEGTGSWLRTMMRIKDKEGNTAFHKGVETCNIDVVRALVKELDPDFSLSANKSGETPIYIAAKTSSNDDVVDAILDRCKSIDLDYGGPDGTTALHAAVVAVDYDDNYDDDCNIVKKLIKAKKQLTKQPDDKGRTPLHYAAHVGYSSAVELLLETDSSVAYMTEKDRGVTALHMAAWTGEADIMKNIISECPGCCEIVDKNGWNFLHYAFVTLQDRELESLFEILPNANFLNEKDVNGNTPYDVFSKFSQSRQPSSSRVLTFLENQRLDKSMSDSDAKYAKKKEQIREMMRDICASANEVAGIPPHKSFRENIEEDDNLPTLKETVDKMRETHLLVVTLIATVTFAAAIAVPGGYKSNEGCASDEVNASDEGTAILSPNSAFKAFVITNAIAFVSSLLAIFLHFLSVFIHVRAAESLVLKCILTADGLTVFAMAAMVVAFSTGAYAVLESSLYMAITTCSIGLTFFPFSLIIPTLLYYFFKRKSKQY